MVNLVWVSSLSLLFRIISLSQGSAIFTEFDTEATSASGCEGSTTFLAVDEYTECSLVCALDKRCVTFLFTKEAGESSCYTCSYWKEASSKTGENILGWKIFQDCADAGIHYTGILRIRPFNSHKSFTVVCDEGWMVIQRRIDGSVDFNRNWNDYKNGFGDVGGEMWLGNDNIHYVTQQAQYKIQYIMTKWNGKSVTREHSSFSTANEKKKYKLYLSVNSVSDPGTSMNQLNGAHFSTIDHDNDEHENKNCAEDRSGGWWFKACARVALNSHYPTCGNCWQNSSSKCMKYYNSGKHVHVLLKSSVVKIQRI